MLTIVLVTSLGFDGGVGDIVRVFVTAGHVIKVLVTARVSISVLLLTSGIVHVAGATCFDCAGGSHVCVQLYMLSHVFNFPDEIIT